MEVSEFLSSLVEEFAVLGRVLGAELLRVDSAQAQHKRAPSDNTTASWQEVLPNDRFNHTALPTRLGTDRDNDG